MKTDIHPDYTAATVSCSCGNEFVTRSTTSEIRSELCSQCHPFYTGKQKLVDTGGRIERFERRFGRRKTAKVEEPEAPEAEAPEAEAPQAEATETEAATESTDAQS